VVEKITRQKITQTQEVMATSNAVRIIFLEASALVAWIEADVEALVAQHLREEEIVASVKKRNTYDEYEASDTGSDSEDVDDK
jgi:hypothetical protein